MRRTTIVMVVAAVVIAGGLVVGGYLLASRTSENNQTTRALCALRDDIKRRVKTSQEYLADHPNGAPGIPAKLVRDGIQNQQRTVEALHDLKCPS